MSTNQLAKRYLEIQETLKAIELEQKAIKEQLVALGTQETETFRILVKEQSRTSLPGMKDLEADAPDLAEQICKRNLLKFSTFKTLKVEIKAVAV